MAPTSKSKTAVCSLCPRRCQALRDEEHGEGWCRLPKYPYHYWLHQSVPEDRHFHHSQMTEITLRDLSVRTWIEE